MDTSSTHVEINHGRRRFLGTAALAVGAVGATQVGMIASAKARTSQAKVYSANPSVPCGPVRAGSWS